MKDIFGISLSDTDFQLVHVFADDNLKTLQSLKNYPYLPNTAFNNALNPENLTHISEIIINYKNENHLSEIGMNFSIPVNFAKTKRVAVPLDANAAVVYEQVEWELNNYLGSSKKDYKIIKTDNEIAFDSYKEILIIAIKKDLIENINILADKVGADLNILSLNIFSVENYFKANELFDKRKNQLVFKVGRFHLDSYLYIGGEYYFSFTDTVHNIGKNKDEEYKRILMLVKDRHRKCLNLIDQIHFNTDMELDAYIYGNGLNNDIYRLISDNFSDKIEKMQAGQFQEDQNTDCAFIETLGIIYSQPQIGD
jgi:Tfp pilus assembly PilM family ATPase